MSSKISASDIEKLSGTRFQKRVWKELIKIPRGKTITYFELARRIGSPRACRAVGNACGKNPLPVAIPCHRVVAANGLGGFTGGLKKKIRLLKLEKSL